jgi:tetratricopeptide (TPR) repeat protein
LLAGAATLILGACAAVAAPIIAEQREPRPLESPYGSYLAGLWADAAQSPEDAARYYSQALERDPGNQMLTEQALHASLLAGDWEGAARLAEAALAADPANTEARLALAVDAMAREEWRDAERLLSEAQFGPLDDIAGAALLAWSHAAQGDEDEALAALTGLEDSALVAPLLGLHQAMIMDRGRDAEAENAYRNALDAYALPAYATREYGRFLERRRRMDDARRAYQERLAAAPDDAATKAELARLQARRRAPRTEPNEGAALALYGAAAALIGRDFSDRAQTYLILSARMDEDFAPTRLLLGQIMASQGRYDQAAAMFNSAIGDPAMGVEARISLAQLESLRGDDSAATEMLRVLWRDDGDEEAAMALAEALRATEQWAEAETLLTELLTAREQRGETADWRFLYGRAVARERQGNWDGAEADFRAAIAFNPSDASLLNYLGYAMVDRGVNLEEGLDLIRQAVALDPNAGYIVDSLGWAYYRLGDYRNAVQNLERAVAMEPGAADINDHLGDAYWRVGRELEARFQWERALTLEPDAALSEAVHQKLSAGLPPAPTPPALAESR